MIETMSFQAEVRDQAVAAALVAFEATGDVLALARDLEAAEMPAVSNAE